MENNVEIKNENITPLCTLRVNAQSASPRSDGSTALPSGVGVSQVYETCGMCKGVNIQGCNIIQK